MKTFPSSSRREGGLVWVTRRVRKCTEYDRRIFNILKLSTKSCPFHISIFTVISCVFLIKHVFSILYTLVRLEAMRLISDLKHDHYEPLNFIQYTTLNSLKRWSEFNRSALIAPPPPQSQSTTSPSALITKQQQTTTNCSNTPYPHREDINGRFILWEGDISLLHVDCITNTTNERLNENNSVSARVANRAGAKLLDELKAIKGWWDFAGIWINFEYFYSPVCLFRLSSWWSTSNTRIFTASTLRHSYSLSKL